MSLLNRRFQIGWAALIMAGSIFLSRFMGLIRDKLISYMFGATSESDLYFAAFVIPDFINYLLAGGYFSITLIPLLASYFEKNEEDGWRFFWTVVSWVGILIVAFTAVAFLLTPYLSGIAAPGLSAESSRRLGVFIRIILPAQICFLVGSCFSTLLYLRKQFLVPALMPLVYNFFIIGGGILLRNRGMEGFCWGVLAGAIVGNLGLPFLAARKSEGLKFRLSFKHPGIKRFFILALPLMLGQSVVVLDEQLVRVFGSLAGTGAISWLNYAHRIMMVPVGVVAQAAGVASYPFMAELYARGELSRFFRTIGSALQNVLVLMVPISIWMMIVALPIVTFIFQGGRFGPEDAERTANLLRVLLVAISCWGLQQLLGRGYYARQDTLTPALLGTLTTVMSIPFYYVLSGRIGPVGVAVSSALSITGYTALLSWWWHRKFGGETFSGLGKVFVRICLVSAVSAVPAYFALGAERLFTSIHPHLGALMAIGASGLCFALFFAVLSARFCPEYVEPYLMKAGRPGAMILRTFRPRAGGA